MKHAYIYPITARTNKVIPNPYIDHFVDSLDGKIRFVNKNKPSKTGAMDMIKFFNKSDIFFFNWIENLPDKKFGIIQSILFIFIFLPATKLTGKKIIWTLHNKEPHDQNKIWLKHVMFKTMLKKSDFIITHAREGMELAQSLSKRPLQKIIYFPHPFSRKPESTIPDKDIDILIWGTMAPYKGIHNFVQLVNDNKQLQQKKIIVMGKFQDPQYKKTIGKLNKNNLEIRDEFIPDEVLEDHLRRSKTVLFTYQQDSVLSSGALCDSMGHGSFIIGPKTGAFKDLAEEGLVHTYVHLNEVPEIVDRLCNEDNTALLQKQKAFMEEFQWDRVSGLLEPIFYHQS